MPDNRRSVSPVRLDEGDEQRIIESQQQPEQAQSEQQSIQEQVPEQQLQESGQMTEPEQSLREILIDPNGWVFQHCSDQLRIDGRLFICFNI